MKQKITTKMIALIAIIVVAIAAIPHILNWTGAATNAAQYAESIKQLEDWMSQDGQDEEGYNAPENQIPFRETKEEREEAFREASIWYDCYYYPKNNSEFNAMVYYVNYPDLQKAFQPDYSNYDTLPNALYNHYVTSGKKEGRVANKVICKYGTFDWMTPQGLSYITMTVFHGTFVDATNRLNAIRKVNGKNAVVLNDDMCFQNGVERRVVKSASQGHHCLTTGMGTGALMVDDFSNQHNILTPQEGHRQYLIKNGSKVGYFFEPDACRSGKEKGTRDNGYGGVAGLNQWVYLDSTVTPQMVHDAYVNNPMGFGSVEPNCSHSTQFDVWIQ